MDTKKRVRSRLFQRLPAQWMLFVIVSSITFLYLVYFCLYYRITRRAIMGGR